MTEMSQRERVARIIIGPRNPVPAPSPVDIEHLRDVRWKQVDRTDRTNALWAADRIIAEGDTLRSGIIAEIHTPQPGVVEALEAIASLPEKDPAVGGQSGFEWCVQRARRALQEKASSQTVAVERIVQMLSDEAAHYKSLADDAAQGSPIHRELRSIYGITRDLTERVIAEIKTTSRPGDITTEGSMVRGTITAEVTSPLEAIINMAATALPHELHIPPVSESAMRLELSSEWTSEQRVATFVALQRAGRLTDITSMCELVRDARRNDNHHG